MQSRTSLDSRFSRVTSPSALYANGFDKPESMEEEPFEDVGLDDEVKPQHPKKRGLFSRFGDFTTTTDPESKGNFPHLNFHLPGRKRGQSGTGSELGAMTPLSTEPGVEKS